MHRQKLKATLMGLVFTVLSVGGINAAGATATPNPTGITEITGAGATFPYPVYGKWAEAYNKQTGIKLNYQSIGSGGGIKQIESNPPTVNFGASDKPLEKVDQDKNSLFQFPAVIGGVVPITNIKGLQTLNLSGAVLGDIFSGAIQKWNDPKIVALNPGVALPDANITVVHRTDGSGTTFIFSHYLFKVSDSWKKLQGWDSANPDKVKADSTAQWPQGNALGGKGNEGVAGLVQGQENSIGYVEFAYVKENHLPYVRMKNKDGNIVEPSIESFSAAADNAVWADAPGYYLILTDQPGPKSWPITGASFILLRKDAAPDINKAVCAFFKWAFENGKTAAKDLNYIPIPDSLFQLIKATWKGQGIDLEAAS